MTTTVLLPVWMPGLLMPCILQQLGRAAGLSSAVQHCSIAACMCCLLLAQAGEYAGQLLAQAHLLQKPYCLPWDSLQLPVTVGSYTTQHNYLPVYRYPRLGQAAQRQLCTGASSRSSSEPYGT